MIKTDEQALEVQKRRFELGRKGTAKSVRRYIKRAHHMPSVYCSGKFGRQILSLVNFDGCRKGKYD